MKRIGFDCDGVCCKYAAAFKPAARACGFSGIFNPAEYWFGIPKELRLAVQDYVVMSGLMETLPVYSEAVKTVQSLREHGHFVACITARGYHTDSHELMSVIEQVTEKWLQTNGLAFDAVIFDHNKLAVATKLNLDMMVEDSLRVAESFLASSIKCFLVDRPWSRTSYSPFSEYDYPWRIRSLSELPALLG